MFSLLFWAFLSHYDLNHPPEGPSHVGREKIFREPVLLGLVANLDLNQLLFEE